MEKVTLITKDIRMTMCLDITGVENCTLFCEHNGRMEKYSVQRGENGFLYLMLVSNEPVNRNPSLIARDGEID